MGDNIGKSGFLTHHHHLIWYFLKIIELNKIKKELKDRSLEDAPRNVNVSETQLDVVGLRSLETAVMLPLSLKKFLVLLHR